MHYKIEKSGCCERDGLVQIRYDLYLDKNDVKYKIYTAAPVHGHFVYFEPTVTDEEIDYIGKIICGMAYEMWIAGKVPNITNQPVLFLSKPSAARKTLCADRLRRLL